VSATFAAEPGIPVPDAFLGGDIRIIFDNFMSITDGNGIEWDTTEGEEIMHEIVVHANPLLRGDRQTGRARLTIENIIRGELGNQVGLKFRPDDINHGN
jgi:hypothetical protein